VLVRVEHFKWLLCNNNFNTNCNYILLNLKHAVVVYVQYKLLSLFCLDQTFKVHVLRNDGYMSPAIFKQVLIDLRMLLD